MGQRMVGELKPSGQTGAIANGYDQVLGGLFALTCVSNQFFWIPSSVCIGRNRKAENLDTYDAHAPPKPAGI